MKCVTDKGPVNIPHPKPENPEEVKNAFNHVRGLKEQKNESWNS